MKYLRLFEDFIRNEAPCEPVEQRKKPVNVKMDEADDEEVDNDESIEKPSPEQLKKKKTPVTKKNDVEHETDEDFPDFDEVDDDDPEIIKEFKAHLNKMERRNRK